jgi:hypothetical protein
MERLKLTSVKLLKSLYDRFKVDTINSSMSLQKLTNRTIHRYNNDLKFKSEMNEYFELQCSGSCL